MKICLVSIILCFCIVSSFGQDAEPFAYKRFTVEELKEDFQVFRSRYENQLVNLYLYTTKPRLDSLFDRLYEHITIMSAEEFYGYITPLSSIIKDGHSNIFPSEEYTTYHNLQSGFLPLQVHWIDDRLFITENLSVDSTLDVGSEILAINGISSAAILNDLLKRQVRDGHNESYARWILDTYFREYYSYLYGHPEVFELDLQTTYGSKREVTMDALDKEMIRQNRSIHYPAQYENANDPSLSSFQLDPELHAGLFTIKSWDNKNLKKEIDHVFVELKKNNIDHLILDLRNNQGGNAEPAIYLLSYLLSEPFTYFSELKAISGVENGVRKLEDKKWAMLGLHAVRPEQYTGKIYILINGGSFSNTAAFCSRMEYYKRGIFFGEETGGNKVVFSGEFGLRSKIVLPNTHIICENANYRMVVTDITENMGRGVVPGNPIGCSVEDRIKDRDVVMEVVRKMIKEGKE